MSTQVILVLVTIKLAMATGAGVLIWTLLRLDTTEERQDDGGGGGGGGGPRLRPGPRRRGPHGGVVPPAPARSRARGRRPSRERV